MTSAANAVADIVHLCYSDDNKKFNMYMSHLMSHVIGDIRWRNVKELEEYLQRSCNETDLEMYVLGPHGYTRHENWRHFAEPASNESLEVLLTRSTNEFGTRSRSGLCRTPASTPQS
eukprot:GHVU01206866.1.p1 GENE.GHVU01206866.1~~GHVU01206866.1.p1  ORF type:complete len:117 (+),score=6.65 GHVU01206866.1:427-777(+)